MYVSTCILLDSEFMSKVEIDKQIMLHEVTKGASSKIYPRYTNIRLFVLIF